MWNFGPSGWASRRGYLVVPVVVALMMALPGVWLVTPAVVDHADEIYQPLRTLSFASSGGQQFHKYGPVPNLLLLPVYGAAMLYWKLTGEFSSPASEYPHGLARPVEQLGTLIVLGRLLFLGLGLLAITVLTSSLRRLTGSKSAAVVSVLALVVFNYRFLHQLPTPMVDASMTAFLLLATAVWLDMLAPSRLTRGRAIAFAVFAAAAAGSKENAIPVLLAMGLSLIAWHALGQRVDRDDEAAIDRATLLRRAVQSVAAGVIVYGLTAVIYAPRVWLERVTYWTTGPGTEAGVWGETPGWWKVLGVSEALLNNLGPAGVVIVAASAVTLLLRRSHVSVVLLVPVLAALGVVVSVPYIPDRFVTPGSLLLTPLIAMAVATWQTHRWTAKTATFALPVLLIIAGWWASVVFHLAGLTEQVMIERALSMREPASAIASGRMLVNDPSLRRLEHLGYAVEYRLPIALLATGEAPGTLLLSAGREQMIREAADMPARRAFYRDEYGIDITGWSGYETAGYDVTRIEATWPTWLSPFSFMPLADKTSLQDMLRYDRRSDADVTSPSDPAARTPAGR